MGYCGPRGIPHSHFLGGPDVWTPLDRDKAIWWMVRQSERCPSCATRDADWDPEQGGRPDAYVAELHMCWGCAATASVQGQIEGDGEPGMTVRLRPNPPAR